MDSCLLPLLELLRAAYPAGVPDEEFLPLLAVLYPHLSDRNLAAVMGQLLSQPSAEILNSVYKAANADFSGSASDARVRERLSAAGYDAWLATID